MHKLRITSKGFAGFTGTLGQVQFIDGVSVEPQSALIANRLGSIMSFELVDEKGAGVGVAGIATHMIANRTTTLESEGATVLVTAAEKKAEDMAEALKARPVTEYHTYDDLVAVADEGGIKGLRKIGDLWKVKGRGIPELIGDILKAQSEHRERFTPVADPAEAEPNAELPEADEVEETAETTETTTPAETNEGSETEGAGETETDETKDENA